MAFFNTLSGNNINSYYLATMLDNAGITNTTTQLQIVSVVILYSGTNQATDSYHQNVILNAWCLCLAARGTLLIDRLGRRFMGIAGTGLVTIFIFMIGGLTAGDCFSISNYCDKRLTRFSIWNINKHIRHLRHGSSHLSLSRIVLSFMVTSHYDLSCGGFEL